MTTLPPAIPAGRKTDRKMPPRRPVLAEPLLIGRWSKTRSGHAAAVSLYCFEGAAFFDVGTQKPDSAGHLIRAGGFAARINHLPRLILELQRALDRARELGLLTDDGGAK